MKVYNTANWWPRLLALGLAGVGFLSTLCPANAAIEETAQDKGGIVEKMQQLQEKMSEAFRNTWKSLWSDTRAESLNEKSMATASIDLREQSDKYVIRLNLPNRDLNKVNVTLTGDTLHITAPEEGSSGRYEQNIVLEGTAFNAQPAIERKQGDKMIVVTVPKSSFDDRSPLGSISALDDWDRDVLERMKRMQSDMDRIFDEAFREFRNESDGFFDRSRFGSSVDLKEEQNNYVVRAYLPARDMKNINVNTDGKTLKIEAKSEDEKQEQASYFASRSHYSQLLTLPGPVDASRMKVDRKENMIVVTLPKQEKS